MRRVLVDYKKLSHEIAKLLIETYPDGYGDDDIIAFRNGKGEFIEAVELRTDDTLYMVKISQSLSHFIANFDDSIERELANKSKVSETDFSAENDSESDKVELGMNAEPELDEEAEIE